MMLLFMTAFGSNCIRLNTDHLKCLLDIKCLAEKCCYYTIVHQTTTIKSTAMLEGDCSLDLLACMGLCGHHRQVSFMLASHPLPSVGDKFSCVG